MVFCCAFGCKERQVKGGSLSFHSFPRDTDRRKRWILNIRREGFKPTEHSRICSKHFTDDCFDREKFGAHLLKKNAVPTIFNFPIHLQKKQRERKTENSSVWEDQSEPNSSDPRLSIKVCENQGDQSEPSTSSSNSRLNSNVCENQRHQSEPSTSSSNARLKRKLFLGDFEEEDMQSPTQAVKLLKVARTVNKLHVSKIKYLSQRKTRLEKKVCSLQEVLKIMRKKCLISQAVLNMLEIVDDDENEMVLSNETTFSEGTMPNEAITPDFSGTSNGFSQPQSTGPPKVKKRKNETSEAEKSQKATSKVSQIVDEKLEKDESLAFCELLCTQLKEMDTDMRQIAMHEINSLIFHLRRGQGKTLDSCDAPNFLPVTGYFED